MELICIHPQVVPGEKNEQLDAKECNRKGKESFDMET